GCAARCFRPDAAVDGRKSDDESEEVWLSVRKWPEPSVPEVPISIARWIAPNSGRDPKSPPVLLDRIVRDSAQSILPNLPEGAPTPVEYELLDYHFEVAAVFGDYLEGSWKPWAQKHHAWRDFQENVYSPLFGIHRDLKRLGEEFELVLGIGCLSWQTPSGHLI